MKIIIAGGSGFLGYSAALELLKQGQEIIAIAHPSELDMTNSLDQRIQFIHKDLSLLSIGDLDLLFRELDGDVFVYALGPDDRTTVSTDPWVFFEEALVDRSKRILSSAIRSGIQRVVVLGSYFAYFDRQFDGILSKHHPYISARVIQEETILSMIRSAQISGCIVELPYIFGTLPHKKPLWKEHFYDQLKVGRRLYFPKGGSTATITSENVAKVIAKLCLNEQVPDRIAPCDENIEFSDMIEWMKEAMNDDAKIVWMNPDVASFFGGILQFFHKLHHRQSGLHYAHLMKDIQSKKLSIEEGAYQSLLGLDTDKPNMKMWIIQTMIDAKEKANS